MSAIGSLRFRFQIHELLDLCVGLKEPLGTLVGAMRHPPLMRREMVNGGKHFVDAPSLQPRSDFGVRADTGLGLNARLVVAEHLRDIVRSLFIRRRRGVSRRTIKFQVPIYRRQKTEDRRQRTTFVGRRRVNVGSTFI
jgi:hypothetical protein